VLIDEKKRESPLWTRAVSSTCCGTGHPFFLTWLAALVMLAAISLAFCRTSSWSDVRIPTTMTSVFRSKRSARVRGSIGLIATFAGIATRILAR